jgi:hypothetical protein
MEKANDGNKPQKTARPRMNAESLDEYTSHETAVRCIHVPTRETDWPKKYSLKFGF